MNYAEIKPVDIANGPGVRVSLFVSGCTHHCKGCFNAIAWDFTYGELYTEAVEDYVLELVQRPYISGLSLLGGEPFEPCNQRVLLPLIRKVKALGNKTIWAYSGYTYETDLLHGGRAHCEVTDEILTAIDVLVDGKFVESLKNISLQFRGSENQRVLNLKELFLPINVDSPIQFTGENFVRSIKANAEILNTTDYIVTLRPRIKTLLTDVRVKKVIDNNEIKLSVWLDNYIGSNNKESLIIIDLSLLPSDVTSIITAVIARMIFEAQQRYLKLNKQCLPTVLVMEEAHYFVKRYNDDAENTGPTTQCCKVFEKIAKEGRKFGLGLVLSSQRPSELSPTVLSQCNSFLLHRISNDRDQELVHRLLPDNMRGILREIPSLPSQHAVLLGWATELPIMAKMRKLPKSQCPQSNDPDFWDVWTGNKKRDIEWEKIANEWQKK